MEQTNTATAKPMNWREFERNNDDVKKAEVLKVPVSRLKVRAGFNPRNLAKQETQEKIRSIANAYKAGRFVKYIEIRLADGEPEIVDGHCRYEGLLLANTELAAAGQPTISETICVPFKGDDLAAIIHTYVGNEGEKLTPMEQAEVVSRLQAEPYNMQRQPIADALGCTIGWVDRLIVINKMPEELREMVRSAKVSMDVALKAHKEHGDKAVEELNKLLASVAESGDTSNGKATVTAKHTREKSEPKEKEQKLDRSGMAAALILGQNMPKIKGVVFEEIKDRQKYTIEVPGVVLKAALALKAKADELDTGANELAAEKAAKKTPAKKDEAKAGKKAAAKKGKKAAATEGQDPVWPFKPVGQKDAAA